MDPAEENEDSPPPLDPSLAPVLLFAGAAAGDATFLYSIPKKRALPAARGFGRGFAADASWITPQGWVLTLDPASRAASLRDPFSSRTVRLPPDREGFLLDAGGDRRSTTTTRCVLSTHRPTDTGCVVLVAHRERPVLFYCRPGGGGRWFQHEYQTDMIYEDSEVAAKAMARVTAVGGRFYGHILGAEKLVALDFSSAHPEPALTVGHIARTPWPAGCCEIRSWKVESCGELFLVRFCLTPLCRKRVVRVEVDRLDWAKSAWVRAAGLGVNRAFFVRTGHFGVSMAADEIGLKPNCVYFTKKDDKGLYVYDMERGTTTLHDLGPEIPESTEPLLLTPGI